MVQKRTLELMTDRAALVVHRDHDTNPQIREQRCAAWLKIAVGQRAGGVGPSVKQLTTNN